MAAYYQAEEKLEEIMAWYDGYRFGERDIFNPWSVVNYFYEDCRPQAYWVSSASNEMIGDLLQEAEGQIRENLRKLLQGGSVLAHVDTDVIYPEVKRNPDSVYSFLLMTGYLKIAETVPQEDGSYMGRFDIALIPLNRDLPGFIFELKQVGKGKQDLKKLAEAALQQIHDKAYVADMKKAGIWEVINLGIAFQGMKIEIVQG